MTFAEGESLTTDSDAYPGWIASMWRERGSHRQLMDLAERNVGRIEWKTSSWRFACETVDFAQLFVV